MLQEPLALPGQQVPPEPLAQMEQQASPDPQAQLASPDPQAQLEQPVRRVQPVLRVLQAQQGRPGVVVQLHQLSMATPSPHIKSAKVLQLQHGPIKHRADKLSQQHWCKLSPTALRLLAHNLAVRA